MNKELAIEALDAVSGRAGIGIPPDPLAAEVVDLGAAGLVEAVAG